MFSDNQATPVDRAKAASILKKIHDEDPSYWPYGLRTDQFDGGLYLVKKAGSDEAVGFVGWQERREDGKDVGYYAIGILPEYRRQGFAKQAVQAIIQKKAAGVDEVRAMVCSHNEPSKSLARSLPVTLIEKMASKKDLIKSIIAHVGGGLGTAAFADQAVDPHGRSIESTLKPWEWDKERALMGGLNLGLGALAGNRILNKDTLGGITAFAAAPTKDLVLKSMGSLSRIDELANAAKSNLDAQPADPVKADLLSRLPKSVLLGALGLGVGGLGVAAYAAKRKADAASAQAEAARAGRVKVTLPTKKPGDAETTLDIPMDDVRLSQALRDRLGRDTRRRLYAETRERTKRRKPVDPNNPTAKEMEDLALAAEEEMLAKESSLASLVMELRPHWFPKSAAAQNAVPSPPNAAARMAQQKATANSIQPSTEANPQILEAQQQASAAQQEAQQQISQIEQQYAQQQMAEQQKFNEQITQAEEDRRAVLQENEILKLNVEKLKMQREIAEAKVQAKEEVEAMKEELDGAADGEAASAVDALLQRRLERLREKAANTYAPIPGAEPEGPYNPKTGRNDPPTGYNLRPGALDAINKSEAYTATGRLAPVGIYRTSYGKVGDWLFDNVLRRSMITPPLPQPEPGMSTLDMLNNPDRMGMISSLVSKGRQAMDQLRP